MARGLPAQKPRPLRRAIGTVVSWLRGPVYVPSAALRGDEDLRCGQCGSTAVCPMEWAPDGETSWTIEARCGECGTWTELWLSNARAARFDVVMDEQIALIARAVERLDAERAARDFESLIEAFRRDLIGPGDFAPARSQQRPRHQGPIVHRA